MHSMPIGLVGIRGRSGPAAREEAWGGGEHPSEPKTTTLLVVWGRWGERNIGSRGGKYSTGVITIFLVFKYRSTFGFFIREKIYIYFSENIGFFIRTLYGLIYFDSFSGWYN